MHFQSAFTPEEPKKKKKKKGSKFHKKLCGVAAEQPIYSKYLNSN